METTRRKAARHYRELAEKQPQYAASQMAELAHGVVVVLDQAGECDVLFEKDLWEFTSPVWRPDMCPMLVPMNLDLLPGMGCAPPVTTIDRAVWFAQEQLRSKTGLDWHPEPQFFAFDS